MNNKLEEMAEEYASGSDYTIYTPYDTAREVFLAGARAMLDLVLAEMRSGDATIHTIVWQEWHDNNPPECFQWADWLEKRFGEGG